MSFRSQLVKDRDTGKICIQVTQGQHAATLELPDHLATATEEELRGFMKTVVPDMIEGLIANRADEARKMRRKVKS